MPAMTGNPPPQQNRGGPLKQIAVGLELPFLLVAPVVVGGAIGWVADHFLHTKPILMIVLGLLGFAIGMRDALKLAGAGDK